MDRRTRELYELLVDYRDRRGFVETPAEVEIALDETLYALSNGMGAWPEDLDTIARFIEKEDYLTPDYILILDAIREFEEKAA